MENSSNNKKITSCCQRIVVILHIPLFPGEVDSNETNQLGQGSHRKIKLKFQDFPGQFS